MSISLLKPCGSDVCTGNVDEKTIYNLSVDKLFKYICADTRKRKYFLDEISKIYCDESVIEFRREILNDFLNFDGLYEELCSVYSAFDDLRLSIKSGLKPDNRMDFSYDSVISSRKNELRVYSLSLKRTLYFVKAVKELLTKHKTDSKGLNELLFECSKIVDKDAFDSLITLCSKYEYISERGLLGFKYTLTPNMRIDNFELIDHKYINVSRNERKKKFWIISKKEPAEKFICQQVIPHNSNFYNTLISGAFSDMASLFKSLTEQIFKMLLPIKVELDFYDVAIKYVKLLKSKKFSLMFPEISKDGNIEIKGLYDILLAIESSENDTIVSNNLSLTNKKNGIIIFGKNGSGKTVFMRAFGVAQLLMQAGLPIPCEKGIMKCYSDIVTQYAEAENDGTIGANLGRFENEVKEMVCIIENLKEDSLILLNETFQSTSYKEGASGLADVLNYLSDKGVTFILVSHLHDLREYVKANNIDFLESNDRYIIS